MLTTDELLQRAMALLAIALNRDITEVALTLHERDDIRWLLMQYKEVNYVESQIPAL